MQTTAHPLPAIHARVLRAGIEGPGSALANPVGAPPAMHETCHGQAPLWLRASGSVAIGCLARPPSGDSIHPKDRHIRIPERA